MLPAALVRRRNPLAIGWVIVACSTLSEAAGGAAIVALLTVAVHCQPRRTFQVALLAAFAGVTCAVLYTHPHHFNYGTLFFWLVVTIAVVGFGAYVRARRELLLSLRDRARRAEDEQHLRVREAQLAERGADRARDARRARASDLTAQRPCGRARVQPRGLSRGDRARRRLSSA